MAEEWHQPSVIQKIRGQSYSARLAPYSQMGNNGIHNFAGTYANGGLQGILLQPYQRTSGSIALSSLLPLSPVNACAPKEKGASGFLIDFMMGGVSAAVSKTAAAPIERVKL